MLKRFFLLRKQKRFTRIFSVVVMDFMIGRNSSQTSICGVNTKTHGHACFTHARRSQCLVMESEIGDDSVLDVRSINRQPWRSITRRHLTVLPHHGALVSSLMGWNHKFSALDTRNYSAKPENIDCPLRECLYSIMIFRCPFVLSMKVFSIPIFKKPGKQLTVCCTLDVCGESLWNRCVQFEFNDVQSLHAENSSGRRRPVSL